MTDHAQSPLRELLKRAQKLIDREFPNGQLAIDIHAALTSTGSMCPDCGRAVDGPTHAAYCAVTSTVRHDVEKTKDSAS